MQPTMPHIQIQQLISRERHRPSAKTGTHPFDVLDAATVASRREGVWGVIPEVRAGVTEKARHALPNKGRRQVLWRYATVAVLRAKCVGITQLRIAALLGRDHGTINHAEKRLADDPERHRYFIEAITTELESTSGGVHEFL